MEIEEILPIINDIFIDVLDNQEIKLSLDTTANDIEEWDSLAHFQLIVAIEKRFDIRFTSLEIQGFGNINDVCKYISEKVR